MGEASRPYHSRSADLFVALVAVALEDAPIIPEELSGTFPRSAHAKVEDNWASRPAVLELVALVVAALGLLALHADWGLVSLDVSAFEQVTLQDGRHREQQLTYGHHGRIESAARDVDPVVSVQIRGHPSPQQFLLAPD